MSTLGFEIIPNDKPVRYPHEEDVLPRDGPIEEKVDR
jgi:hypothetical protein